MRIKGVRLVDLDDGDASFDAEISLSIQELWSSEHVEGARSERGCFLVAYSYHAHWHGIDQRWDFDPNGYPEQPYHFHPPSGDDTRSAGEPISPEQALAVFEDWLRPHGFA